MTVHTRGFDCGFGPPDIADAQASQYGGFWAAYLRKRTASGIHVLTAQTLQAYKGKRPLVFLYEDADAARMTNSGHAGGAQDAQFALDDLAALGVTGWQCVYFCADTDTNASTYDDVDAYLQGVATKIPVAKIGLYGEADLVDYIRARNRASWFFQPCAWSNHRIADGVHIYQGNSQTKQPWQAVIGGITCDIDEALQPNYGQWPTPAAPPSPNQEDDFMGFINNQDDFNNAMSTWANANPDKGFRKALDTYFATRIPDTDHNTPGSISERLADRIAQVLTTASDNPSNLNAIKSTVNDVDKVAAEILKVVNPGD